MANTTEKVLSCRIKLVDNFSRPIQQATKNTQKFQNQAKRVSPLMLKAKDLASKVINMVLSKAKAFAKGTWTAVVKVKDMASSVLGSLTAKLSALAGGVTIGVALKTGVEGLGNEQMQKITIGNAIQNTGKDKATANKMADDYYKQLEEFANVTPFTNEDVAGFGVKAIQMSKGNIDKAMDYTKAQGSVKALVGDMRTAQEVSEAFFSASNGNMDSINNILGEKYKNFGELIEGVNKKQADVLGDMSTTIPGLLSTISGKASNSMKKFVEVFKKPLSDSLNSIIGFIDKLTPKLVATADKMMLFYDQIQESGELATIMQMFGNVSSSVFSMIKAVVEACTPTVQKIMTFMSEHSDVVNGAIEGLKNTWEGLCRILGPVLSLAWSIIEPILLLFLDTLYKLGDLIQGLADWWTNLCNTIKNNPIVAKVTEVWDSAGSREYVDSSPKAMGGKKNAFGSGRIARNNELHTLHQGEKVLTKQQANELDRNGSLSGGITVNMNGITVREEADINKIAKQFVRELKIAQFGFAGGN